MDLENLLPENVFQILAVDFGLLILAAWFFILLLILREFREFAIKVTANKLDDQTLSMCQNAIDNAMSYANDNAETINELIKVQHMLQSQLADVKSAAKEHATEEEKALIEDLNRKLTRSNKLVRKLKGDLDEGAKRLKSTREKLYSQYNAVEKLQKEKEEVEQRFAQLEKEFEEVAKGGNVEAVEREHQIEKQNLVQALAQYKKQIEEQEQSIAMLQQNNLNEGSDVRTVQKELAEAENKLKFMTKEKDFVENRYLDLLKQVEK